MGGHRWLEGPKLLEKHRHALFHADHYDHKDIRRFAEQKEPSDWADKVATAIGNNGGNNGAVAG